MIAATASPPRASEPAAGAVAAPVSIDRWHTARLAFAVLAMFLATSAFYNFSFQVRPPKEAGVLGNDESRSDVVNMLGWILLYGISGVTVLWSLWRQGLELRLALLIPFALYILASATWSYEPAQSLIFCVMLVANIVVADALATQVPPALLLGALTRVVVPCVAFSLVLLVVQPELVTTEPDRPGLFTSGEFNGVFSHKIHMGINAASAILVLLFQPDSFSRSRRLRWISLLICTAGLVLANSASAILALVVSVALIVAVKAAPRLRGTLFLAIGLITLLFSVLLPHIDLGSVTGLVGRSSTLTGRGDFWALAPGYIAKHPWIGFGYGGFFQRDAYSQVWDLWSYFEYFFTPNFHNSALDTLILLGYIGLAGYLIVLATGLWISANRSLGSSADILACILILFTASSATDFQFMRHNCLATILLFYTFLVGGRVYGARRADRSARAGA
ncbi:O-antigen ligase family protein [Methylobacterium sp. J-068]|uniref:O-antigen ligase family protein n=1 Tax=Methylobacterium sp. J-068 TaxID=2836649 RepID=UPI001FBC0448|nr:O-antigen ligase family protein [Methylobacterium sp. J-068]MCJ2033489.1 O-antigen ligase family protein [Methylobacterium sp. J-068]